MYTFEVSGKSLRQYKGMGTLIAPDDTRFEGGFEFVQRADGRLVGKFYFEDRALDLPVSDPEGRFLHYALKGTTIQGWDAWSDTLYIVSRTHNTPGPDEVVFHAVSMEVTLFELTYDTDNSAMYFARFGLVNLQFDGNRIDLDVNGHKISINKVDGYSNVIEFLKTHRGIEVTCEAFVRLKDAEVTDRLLSTMRDICVLLSFASGTRVNWVYHDIMIAPKMPARSYLFGDAITLPFSTHRLIARSQRTLAQFVNNTFDVYRAKKEDYGLYSVLAMYLVAKIPHLFVGSRILLINQALEALKSSMTPEYMLDEAKLDEELKALTGGIKKTWLKSFPELRKSETKSTLDAITSRERVKGLARLSYPRGLKNVVESLQFPREHEKELKDRINKLIAVRNVLTHDALTYEKTDVEAYQDFTRFINLTDVILLKILEYKGEYLDCSDGYVAKTLD
ncbi:MAG: hypothetical protein H8D43_01640 [Chloroflexi bacterium]|nr:hypothetical protein [Chloroflexota bacterium]